MGYGAEKTRKRAVTNGTTRIYVGGKKAPHMRRYKKMVVDFNAWFRSLNFGPEITPRLAIHIFWGSLFGGELDPEVVVICFDDYERNNEMRGVYYEREFKKKEANRGKSRYVDVGGKLYHEDEVPMDAGDVALLTEDCMPSTWPRMWSNKAAKQKMYRLCSKLLKGLINKGAKTNPHGEYVIHDMDGEIWSSRKYPGGIHESMVPCEYGEADYKSLLWALHLGAGTLYTTIDWDSMFTIMPYADFPIDILISKSYVSKFDAKQDYDYDPSRVHYNRSTALKAFSGSCIPAFEIIHVSQMVGPGMPLERFDRRLVYVMAILSFSGCDYCEGLNRYGYTDKPMGELLPMAYRCEPFVETRFRKSDPYRRILRFYPSRYLLFLRYGSPNKPKNGLAEFNKEVHNMLWILRYIMQFDSMRKPSGPPLPDYTIDLFPGARTVSEAISDSTLEHLVFGEPHVDFYEEYPTHNPVSRFGYPPAQARELFDK